MQKCTHSIKGLISRLYNLLLDHDMTKPLLSQLKWQRDCPNSITAEDWPHLWTAPCFQSPVFSIHFQAIKTFLYWYLTPDRLFYMGKLSTPLCWKECGNRGDYIHTWRSSELIKTFGGLVLQDIKNISGHSLPLSPEFVICQLIQLKLQPYKWSFLVCCFGKQYCLHSSVECCYRIT